jgi:hypothetical protein
MVRACILLSLLSLLGTVGCSGGGSAGPSAAKPPDALPRYFVSSRPAPTPRQFAAALRGAGIHVRTAGGHVILEASNHDHEPAEGILTIMRTSLDPSPRIGPLHTSVPCTQPTLSGLYANNVILQYSPEYRKGGSCPPSARDLTAQLARALGSLTPRSVVKAVNPKTVVTDALKATIVNQNVSP